LGILTLLLTLLVWTGRALLMRDAAFPPVVRPGGWVELLITVNLASMILFLVVRAAFVGAVYGRAEGAPVDRQGAVGRLDQLRGVDPRHLDLFDAAPAALGQNGP
jgi:hypothetical protein